MKNLSIKNIRIAGMAACVPRFVEENIELSIFSTPADAQKLIASTGIERKRCVSDGVTASDLTVKAVDKLLTDLNWERESIDCFIYVCTSRDFIAPQTSCILQDRLGLSQECLVIDLPLGCSGWIYGMSVISSLISHGFLKRGLLVAAETNTKNRSMKDKTVKPLFGDAATVTALEFDANSDKLFNFVFGVDGSGYQAVWTKYGGMRFPTTPEALKETQIEEGIIRKGTDMIVNGMDVFAFAIKQPARSIKKLVETFNIDLDKIDYLLLHQANKLIDEKIRKSLKIPEEKVPYCIQDFGNVTSASIPLTMITQMQKPMQEKDNYCVACGFGVGLAWASMEFHVGNIICSDLIVY